jgi:membrane-associated HD superfamily phosphohydrolase
MGKDLTRYGGAAAILGGAMYVLAFVATMLIYSVFKEQVKGTFFAEHAFIHIIDVAAFGVLFVGALAVLRSQAAKVGRVAKAGFFLTLAGFGLSVVGGLTIIVVGLAVSDEATLGILDIVTHPIAQLLYTLGSAVFGVALLRKGTLPKAGALLVAVGPAALFALFMTGNGNAQAAVPIMACVAATGLGWAMLGIGLRAERAAPSGREEIAAGPAPAAR